MVIADDLSGAADAVAGYGSAYSAAVVLDSEGQWPDAEILAIDTESRYLPASEAAAVVAQVVRRALTGRRRVFKKIDSLLRGHVGVEIAAALVEMTDGGVGLALIAPAFPANGRTTVDGVVHVNGLANTRGDFNGSIKQALAMSGLEVGAVLATAGQTPEALAAQLRRMMKRGINAAIFDAVSDAELLAVVHAADLVDAPTLLAGSGGLASQIAPRLEHAGSGPIEYPQGLRTLVVIGSYSALAQAQRRALVDAGVRHVIVDHSSLLTPMVPRDLAHAIDEGDVVLTPDSAVRLDKSQARLVARALAIAAVAVIDRCDALVLTGGETARAVLHELGTVHMRVIRELGAGIVLSQVSIDLPLVVTKAGAFGDADTLVRAIELLKKTH